MLEFRTTASQYASSTAKYKGFSGKLLLIKALVQLRQSRVLNMGVLESWMSQMRLLHLSKDTGETGRKLILQEFVVLQAFN